MITNEEIERIDALREGICPITGFPIEIKPLSEIHAIRYAYTTQPLLGKEISLSGDIVTSYDSYYKERIVIERQRLLDYISDCTDTHMFITMEDF